MRLPHHNPDTLYDYLGQKIQVGDFVTYATGGTSATMHLARIEDITLKSPGRMETYGNGRQWWRPAEFKVRVKVFMEGSDPVTRWDSALGKHQTEPRLTTLTRNSSYVRLPVIPNDLRLALEEKGLDIYA